MDRIATVAIGGDPTTTENAYLRRPERRAGAGRIWQRHRAGTLRPGRGSGAGLGKRHHGAVSWLLADNEGTVRDVATYNAGTGTTTIADHLVYDAFGNIAWQTPNTGQPRFTYTGQQFDAATSCIITVPGGMMLGRAGL